jgi:dTDP-4-amino-4,6-dideoxygalactose transaminase
VTTSTVPFLDMRPMHEPLRDAILAGVADVIDANAYVNGPQIAAFEAAYASYCDAAHCVAVASGLDALRLALVAARLPSGAEVIVPANTFVATAEAVTQAGLRPVLADVREDDLGLDPEAVAAAIGPRTAAIVPVHLYGQLCDMRSLTALAARHGLAIVADSAQAHGASRDGFHAGSGLAAAFSFYPGKNLGAMGDAGALVTDDAPLADRARALREHGQRRKYVHEWEGYTARMDTIQAVVLSHKLPHLDAWNAARREAARAYTEQLTGVGDLRLPMAATSSSPVWHLYVVRTADPEALAAFLRERGIGTGRHYPIPVHLAPAFAYLGLSEGTFPVAESACRECLSLPIFPGITDDQVSSVVAGISAFFDRGG